MLGWLHKHTDPGGAWCACSGDRALGGGDGERISIGVAEADDGEAGIFVSVAPSEGTIMAAPEGAKAPLVDGSEDARRHGTQPVMVMRTNQARSQGERKEKQGAAAPCAAINS